MALISPTSWRCALNNAAGGYYYYHTENGKDYQDTMLDVKAYIQSIKLPVYGFQFDSWWYYRQPNAPENGGLTTIVPKKP